MTPRRLGRRSDDVAEADWPDAEGWRAGRLLPRNPSID